MVSGSHHGSPSRFRHLEATPAANPWELVPSGTAAWRKEGKGTAEGEIPGEI